MLERRRAPRFYFQQPVSLKVQGDVSEPEVQGVTVNTSALGVYLTTDSPVVALGLEVEVSVAMPHGIQACSSGKVVRVNRLVNGGKTGVAVECSQRFSEVR